MHKLELSVSDYFVGQRISRGDQLVVACSGGPDSTALFKALCAVSKPERRVLCCTYLDHGLRERAEIEADIDFVRNMAALERMPCYVLRSPSGRLAGHASAHKRSLEDAAREWRYARLAALAGQIGARFVVLGHTLDDRVETLVMRFFQGSGYGGLAGIPARRGIFLRPLFDVSREEVMDYIGSRRLSYRTDSTNADEKILRNKTRRRLIPVIEKAFPHFRSGLIELSGKMGAVRDFLDDEAGERLEWDAIDPADPEAGFRIDGEKFLSAPGLLRIHALYQLYDRMKRTPRARYGTRLPHKFLAPLTETGRVCSRSTVLQGHGIRLVWEGADLFLRRHVASHSKKGYLIVANSAQEAAIKGTGLSIGISDIKSQACRRGSGRSARIAASFPIIIRSRKPGDVIKTKIGEKSLKKLFIEWKVPAALRWKIPVVVHSAGVAAVLGEKLGFRDRFCAELNDNNSSTRSSGITLSVTAC
jgi:tRNA(Ile)-lysidine synthase